MSQSIDEQWIKLRIKMLEFEQELSGIELPDGVYMHNATQRIEQRFSMLITQAWLEIADSRSILVEVGKSKGDL